MEKWKGHAGATLLIGKPARPMSAERQAALGRIIRQCEDVLFAYAPQAYLAGRIDPPAQILYLVLRDDARVRLDQVMGALVPRFNQVLPAGEYIDVVPAFVGDQLLTTVVATETVLAVNDAPMHQQCAENLKQLERDN